MRFSTSLFDSPRYPPSTEMSKDKLVFSHKRRNRVVLRSSVVSERKTIDHVFARVKSMRLVSPAESVLLIRADRERR